MTPVLLVTSGEFKMVDIAASKLVAGPLFFLASSFASALPASPLEESVCGSFREWLAFRVWSSAAGKPVDTAFREIPNAQQISHVTVDNRTLRGFRISPASPSKGSVLFAQGNAMLADQTLESLSLVADAGFDVFVFDFRGYGRSEGTARLKAIVSDYLELANAIVKAHPGKLYFYGVSFGGIILLNTLNAAPPVSATLIDSSPSTVSDLGCPPRYDPVTKIPDAADSILLVVGDKDRVIPPAKSAQLANKVIANGGQVRRREEFSHPFMDSDEAIATSRLKIAIEFFNSK
jgi:pimeloyl-ACP methyl ester carboxylesterase